MLPRTRTARRALAPARAVGYRIGWFGLCGTRSAMRLRLLLR
ncbi:hypothetical protein BSLA_01r3058 [Burkholderia stabilis]|nr:hypothetical protein BSLA_01r3058 [Burkholderia stabilis]